MTIWTPQQTAKLAERWGHVHAKQISQEIFGTPYRRAACIGKARRMGLEKLQNPVQKTQWDDVRFKELWNCDVTVTHMGFIFHAGNDAVRRHARELRLYPREKIDRVVKKRILKKSIIPRVKQHSVKPAPELPLCQFTGTPQEKGWFRDSTDCACGFKMPPGGSRCYSERHA